MQTKRFTQHHHQHHQQSWGPTAQPCLQKRAPTNPSFSCSPLLPPMLSPHTYLEQFLGSFAPCAGLCDPPLAVGAQGAATVHPRLYSCSLGKLAGSWCRSPGACVPAGLVQDGWGRQGLAPALTAARPWA